MSIRRDITAARRRVATLGESSPSSRAAASGPLSLLVASLDALVCGRRAEAAALARRATSGARALPLVDYGAGVILHLGGDFATAYARLTRGLGAAAGKVAMQIAETTRVLATSTGDAPLRRAMLEQLASSDPRPAHLFELAELEQMGGRLDAMAAHLAKLVADPDPELAARAWTMWTERGRSPKLAAKLDAWIEQRAAALTPALRLTLAWAWIELGEFDRAEALVEGLSSPSIDLARARWSLWRGHDQRAAERCAALLADAAALEPSLRIAAAWIEAVTIARRGQLDDGLAALDLVLAEGCDDSEAWLWRVELGLRNAEAPDALRPLLTRGQARRVDDGVVTEVLENLLSLRARRIDDGRRHYRSERGDDVARAMIPLLCPALAHLGPRFVDDLDALDDAGLEARLWSALDHLAGYRGGRVEIVTGHAPSPPAGPKPNPDARALHWLRAGWPERAFAYDELGTEGRAARLIRAEAAWRCGRPDQALWIAGQMLDDRDDELGAWVIVGLAGDEALAETALARLLELAPALVARCAPAKADALDPAAIHDGALSPEQTRALLERAAVELIDDRATQPSFGQSLAELRTVQLRELARFARGLARILGVDPRALLGPISRIPEPAWLAQARRERAHALLDAARPRTAPALRRRPTPTLLSPAQIDQFTTHGYLKLERCFDPADARAWIEAANRRIATNPDRWVKGYDPRDPARSLAGYDAADPATWTWPYIDVIGQHSFFIAERAPRAWQAIGDLLGGHERVETWTWTDSAKPNFYPSDPSAREVHPDAETWHIDNPSTAMTLQGLTNGLICVVLLSSIGPGMGATMLCPDSLAPVARLLVDHPEGYDFVAPDAGAQVTRCCHEFVEATGEPGDVYFLHPLVMHTTAPNPSGTIRWMSNPLVRVRAPLELAPDDPVTRSPVEQAIIDALSR